MSTLAVLKTKLRNYLKCDPSDKIWAESQKDEYLNNAYFHVQKDGNFNWAENQASPATLTLTGGTATVALPTGFIRLDLVQLATDNNKLFKTTKVDVMQRGTTSNSKPSEYYIYGGVIGFYPTPDTGYTATMLYRKRLTTMTSAVDCAFPEDFDDGIIKYAAYQIWSTTKNTSKAAQALQDYKMTLDTLKMGYQVQDTQDFSFAFQKFRGSRYNSARSL